MTAKLKQKRILKKVVHLLLKFHLFSYTIQHMAYNNLGSNKNFRGKFWGQAPRPNMEVPPGDILKVAVSTLSAKAKLFNNSIFNPNGNVAQDQDDDDKVPSQGQIVDLPAIHSQMTDTDIKKNIFKKENLLEMSVTRAKRIVSEVFYF